MAEFPFRVALIIFYSPPFVIRRIDCLLEKARHSDHMAQCILAASDGVTYTWNYTIDTSRNLGRWRFTLSNWSQLLRSAIEISFTGNALQTISRSFLELLPFTYAPLAQASALSDKQLQFQWSNHRSNARLFLQIHLFCGSTCNTSMDRFHVVQGHRLESCANILLDSLLELNECFALQLRSRHLICCPYKDMPIKKECEVETTQSTHRTEGWIAITMPQHFSAPCSEEWLFSACDVLRSRLVASQYLQRHQ